MADAIHDAVVRGGDCLEGTIAPAPHPEAMQRRLFKRRVAALELARGGHLESSCSTLFDGGHRTASDFPCQASNSVCSVLREHGGRGGNVAIDRAGGGSGRGAVVPLKSLAAVLIEKGTFLRAGAAISPLMAAALVPNIAS